MTKSLITIIACIAIGVFLVILYRRASRDSIVSSIVITDSRIVIIPPPEYTKADIEKLHEKYNAEGNTKAIYIKDRDTGVDTEISEYIANA